MSGLSQQRAIPEEFINYIFWERRKMLKEMLSGVKMRDIRMGFTGHTPVVSTYGPSVGDLKRGKRKPVYIFRIREMYNNTPPNFGEKIYP